MSEVLNSNIQELIDQEAAIGVNMTQSETGQRSSKLFIRKTTKKHPLICYTEKILWYLLKLSLV